MLLDAWEGTRSCKYLVFPFLASVRVYFSVFYHSFKGTLSRLFKADKSSKTKISTVTYGYKSSFMRKYNLRHSFSYCHKCFSGDKSRAELVVIKTLWAVNPKNFIFWPCEQKVC